MLNTIHMGFYSIWCWCKEQFESEDCWEVGMHDTADSDFCVFVTALNMDSTDSAEQLGFY